MKRLFCSFITMSLLSSEIKKEECIKPRYAVLMLSADPYASDTESDGESDALFSDNKFLKQISKHAAKGEWHCIPFTMCEPEKKIKSALVEDMGLIPQKTRRISQLTKRITEEAFHHDTTTSQQEADVRLRQVVLANRLKSISRKRNYTKQALYQAPQTTQADQATVLAYHLVPRWYEWRGEGYAPVNVERVQRFFRAWKLWEQKHHIDINSDKSMARAFRLHYERDIFKGHVRTIVPFHTLRETLKSHPATADYVRAFYAQEPSAPIYLSFFDDDFGPLTTHGQSLFASYDEIVESYKQGALPIPSIMTTGYRFTDGSVNAIAVVGNEIDRAVRIATASVIPNGVCYPEPNVLVRVPNPLATRLFNATFATDLDGKSQTETVQFIKALYATGEATPQTTLFARGLPIYTAPSKEILEQSQKVYHGSDGRCVIEWDQHAIKYLRTFSQSHLEPRDLAKTIVAALTLSTAYTPKGFGFDATTKSFTSGSAGQTRHNIAICAVSRMITAYNPINTNIIELYKDFDAQPFRQVFHELLKNYDTYFPRLYEAKKKTTSKSLYGRYLLRAQTVDTIEELRVILTDIVGRDNAILVEEAAKRSGHAIARKMLEYFDFSEQKH